MKDDTLGGCALSASRTERRACKLSGAFCHWPPTLPRRLTTRPHYGASLPACSPGVRWSGYGACSPILPRGTARADWAAGTGPAGAGGRARPPKRHPTPEPSAEARSPAVAHLAWQEVEHRAAASAPPPMRRCVCARLARRLARCWKPAGPLWVRLQAYDTPVSGSGTRDWANQDRRHRRPMCVHGGDKPGHWSASVLLSAAE
jgi:hypothetical protein